MERKSGTRKKNGMAIGTKELKSWKTRGRNGTMADLCYSFSTQKQYMVPFFPLCYSLLSFLIMIVGLAGLHLTYSFVHTSSTLYFTLIQTYI